MSGGTTAADPSRSRTADGTGFCADHRKSGSVPMWQADRELSGTGAAGGLERESTTAGPYHQTRQFSVALLVSALSSNCRRAQTQGRGIPASCTTAPTWAKPMPKSQSNGGLHAGEGDEHSAETAPRSRSLSTERQE